MISVVVAVLAALIQLLVKGKRVHDQGCRTEDGEALP